MPEESDQLSACSILGEGEAILLNTRHPLQTTRSALIRLLGSPPANRYPGDSGSAAGEASDVAEARPDILGMALSALARMALGVDGRPTSHRCAVASAGLAAVLALEVEEQGRAEGVLGDAAICGSIARRADGGRRPEAIQGMPDEGDCHAQLARRKEVARVVHVYCLADTPSCCA